MNRGRGSRDVLHIWLHFSLFNVANVLHCLYNLKKSNLKCVTSKNLVTTCKLVGYMVFSRYAIIKRPHIQPGYLVLWSPGPHGFVEWRVLRGRLIVTPIQLLWSLDKARVTQLSSERQDKMPLGCQCYALFCVALTLRQLLKNCLFLPNTVINAWARLAWQILQEYECTDVWRISTLGPRTKVEWNMGVLSEKINKNDLWFISEVNK